MSFPVGGRNKRAVRTSGGPAVTAEDRCKPQKIAPAPNMAIAMYKEAVQEFIDRNKEQAEKLVTNVFPIKVKELDDFLHSDLFSLARLDEIKVDLKIPVPPAILLEDIDPDGPLMKKRRLEIAADGISGSKVTMFSCGSIPMNQHLVDMIDKMKPKIMELMDSTNMVKMWIQMNIPKIEDGNNFGVSIQEEILAEARQSEGEAATFLDQMTRYFIHRGKLVSRLAKYPHVDDYRRSVQELDEKEFITLRLVCCELRNHYAGLHDLITKNLDKIRKPRSLNVDTMY